MNDHIMPEDKVKIKKKNKIKKRKKIFLKNCDGHRLYMIIQSTVCQVGQTWITS